jgi:hypothetical protein
MRILSNRLARLTIIAGVLLASGRQMRVAQAQESAGAEHGSGIADVTTRFADTVSLVRAKGAPTPLRVEFKEWHLAGQGLPIELRDQGFYVAQLVWGNVSTQIGDTSTVRKPGDFWTVEKGQRMIVTIKKPGEEALIQTFAVNPGH